MNLDRQLADDQLRIIGVEFNIRDSAGNKHELAMFTPNGTGLILPRVMSVPARNFERNYYRYVPLITFHSTIGDYTIGNRDNECPW